MKYSPIILLAVLTLAAPGTAQELQDNISFEELAARAQELTSVEAETSRVRRVYGLAFYSPGVAGSAKLNVCLYKDEGSIVGNMYMLGEDLSDFYSGYWFSYTDNGRTWFLVLGPNGEQTSGSWENFSSAVVAGQWVQEGPDGVPSHGSVKGQQLSFNSNCE